MRTLIISVDHPVAEDKGSKIRTMTLARFFRRFGDVDLMCHKHLAEASTEGFFTNEHLIAFPLPEDTARNVVAEAYQKLVYKKSWLLSHFSGPVVDGVNMIIKKGGYDHIVCRYVVNAFPLLFLPDNFKKKVVLDVDDVMSADLYRMTFPAFHGLAALKAHLDLRIFLKYQEKCLYEFGKILFCSEEDKGEFLRKKKRRDVYVVPNTAPKVKVPENYQADGFGNIDSLLFVGTLSYRPNEQGLLWFLEQVFPVLCRTFPKIHLVVIGKNPTETLQNRCGSLSNVQLVVNPPDVTPFYQRCGAVIVPLLAGGGTRIKILEAGLLRRPVISTPAGAYGLDVVDRREVVLFNDPETFVQAYTQLRNQGIYGNLTENLYTHVANRYRESSIFARLEEVVSAVLPPAPPV